MGESKIVGVGHSEVSYFVKSALLSLTVAIYGNYIRGFSNTYSAHMETLIILLLTVISKKKIHGRLFFEILSQEPVIAILLLEPNFEICRQSIPN